MIGPESQHPRSVLKRRHPEAAAAPEVAVKRPAPDMVDIVSEVCSYETISDYIQLFGNDIGEQEQGGSPASLESGYHTAASAPDDEDSNLSWLLNFKVSSLFDPAEDHPPIHREDTCVCANLDQHRSAPGKPPLTYTELIEKALKEQGELTVSGIYSWISSKYPFYSPSDDRWKNSVRHNLSINPHFRKGLKSRHGAGHLWTLSNEGVHPPPESWKRTRSVVPPQVHSPPPMMDEAAMAAATIMQLEEEEEDKPEVQVPPTAEKVPVTATPVAPVPQPDLAQPLHRVAEEILSGVKRSVQVQYLVHDNNAAASNPDQWLPENTILLTLPSQTSWYNSYHHFSPEFLNPVSKEEIVSESGLVASHCDMPSSLLSDLHSELHLPDNLFGDELSFPCYSQL